MKDKRKSQEKSKTVNADSKKRTNNIIKDADAVDKKRKTKLRETKTKRVYIPLGATLSLILPSFKTLQAKESSTHSSESLHERATNAGKETNEGNTETTHSALTKTSQAEPEANAIIQVPANNAQPKTELAHSSNYLHSPVISHPFFAGYTVATTTHQISLVWVKQHPSKQAVPISVM